MIYDDHIIKDSNVKEGGSNSDNEEYKVSMTNFYKPHDGLQSGARNHHGSKPVLTNDFNSKATQSLSSNMFDYKPRYSRKVNPTKLSGTGLRKKTFSNEKPDLNDPFWAFNESSTSTFGEIQHLNGKDNEYMTKKIKSISLNTTRQTNINQKSAKFKNHSRNVQKIINKIEQDNEQSVESTSNIDTGTNLNSVIKWSSNHINQIVPYSPNTSVCVDDKFNTTQDLYDTSMDKFNETLVEMAANKENKKVKLEKNVHIQTPPTINKLFDIIEREGTNFSIKMQYDNPFSTSRPNNITPHTYLDLEIDPQLKLARQNTFKNRDMIDFDQLEKKRNNNFKLEKINDEIDDTRNSSCLSPDDYQDLENPAPLNLYSELRIKSSRESLKKKKIKGTTKQIHYIKAKPVTMAIPPKVGSEKNRKSSVSTSVYQSVDLENLPIHDKDDENIANYLHLNSDSKNSNLQSAAHIQYMSNELYKLQQLSSNSILDQLNSSIISSQSLQTPPNDKKLYRKDDLKMLDSLISSMKIKEILKETPTKRSSSKTIQKPSKSTSKKQIVKEFKYCILTDLKIGEGEFSETFQGYRYDLGSPIKIAAKRLKNCKDDLNTVNFLSEISVLTQLGKHDNVIEYLGVHNFNNTMYMIFEYAEKGDLKRLLDQCRKNVKREVNVNSLYKLKVAYEIACGMEYISSLDIVHKDLAARNILLDKDFNCKISDFGCCKSEFLTKRPIRWMAPESLNKLLFTTASDVWSYGVLLWEVYTSGMTPYPGMTDDEVVGRINQWYRLYKPQECPNEVYAIMLSCWKEYHKARPRFTNIKNKFRDLFRVAGEVQLVN